MTNIILVILVLIGLVAVAVVTSFRQLSTEIRGLEKEHEKITKQVSQSDADLFQRWKRQQKDLGNLASDFEQFKLNYGAALEYNRESFLVIQREESKRKAEEAEKAVMDEQRARVKAVSEKILDAFSKLLTNDKLTPDEASAAFETELQILIAEYANELSGVIKDEVIGVEIPDDAVLQIGSVSDRAIG